MTTRTKPGPEFDTVRAAIKAAGHRVTPYRLGVFTELAGLALPNPYSPGSLGYLHFRDGVTYTRRNPRR